MPGNGDASVKVSVFIATSLDGFIARHNGALDWLPGSSADTAEDYGYTAFMDTVDVLVLGRYTYEHVLTFAAWPYGSKPVVVLSHQQVPLPQPHLAASVDTLAGTPSEVVCRLAARGARHLYVDGGKTIQGFLAAGCVQQLIITRVPILLGSGRALFGPLSHDILLRHLATRSYATGLVQSTYEVTESRQARGQGI